MLKIHQPYKSKYIFAFASIGVLLLGMGMFANFFISSSRHQAYAAGDSRTIHDIENMQDITQQICSNTEEGDTETLRDSRDPNSYTIVKLEDGNCWMYKKNFDYFTGVMTNTFQNQISNVPLILNKTIIPHA